jgi:hypothetical protein
MAEKRLRKMVTMTTSDVSLRPRAQRVERPDRAPVKPPTMRVTPGASQVTTGSRKAK